MSIYALHAAQAELYVKKQTKLGDQFMRCPLHKFNYSWIENHVGCQFMIWVYTSSIIRIKTTTLGVQFMWWNCSQNGGADTLMVWQSSQVAGGDTRWIYLIRAPSACPLTCLMSPALSVSGVSALGRRVAFGGFLRFRIITLCYGINWFTRPNGGD